MDYIVIVNSIDIKTSRAIFKEYDVLGNGSHFPEQTSLGLNSILHAIKFEEIRAGRIAIDVTTLIDYNGQTIWDSPGLSGSVSLK